MGLYVLELKLFEQFFNDALPRADNINNVRGRVQTDLEQLLA